MLVFFSSVLMLMEGKCLPMVFLVWGASKAQFPPSPEALNIYMKSLTEVIQWQSMFYISTLGHLSDICFWMLRLCGSEWGGTSFS